MSKHKKEDLEDALTECLYHALIEKDPDKKEVFTKMAVSMSNHLTENQVNRSKDYAVYRAKQALPR